MDVKPPNLVKGIQLEGLRVMGDPAVFAQRYYEQGIDELIYTDIVASLYGRNNLVDLVRRTAERIFVPLTVGGGVRSIADMRELLRAGAEKVSINTAAIRRPELITEAATAFGSQCVVVAIETIRQPSGAWLCVTDNGREHTGIDAIEWAHRVERLGAGEILLTSVDRDGMGNGCDTELVALLTKTIRCPIIVHGGAGSAEHVAQAFAAGADGVAVASLLHYGRDSVRTIKQSLRDMGVEVRR